MRVSARDFEIVRGGLYICRYSQDDRTPEFSRTSSPVVIFESEASLRRRITSESKVFAVPVSTDRLVSSGAPDAKIGLKKETMEPFLSRAEPVAVKRLGKQRGIVDDVGFRFLALALNRQFALNPSPAIRSDKTPIQGGIYQMPFGNHQRVKLVVVVAGHDALQRLHVQAVPLVRTSRSETAIWVDKSPYEPKLEDLRAVPARCLGSPLDQLSSFEQKRVRTNLCLRYGL